MAFLKSIVVLIFATTLMLSFQNCGQKFNSISSLDPASTQTISCAQSGSLSCASQSVSMNVNNQSNVEIQSQIAYPFIVNVAKNESLVPQSSYIKAISGSCPANTSWAPLQKSISPWTYTENSTTKNISAGLNNITFSTTQTNEMAGCLWQACIQTQNREKSCITMTFKATSSGVGGNPTPTTCNANTRPQNQTVSRTCSNNASLSYTETTTYTCNTSTLLWVGQTTNNASTQCQSSSQTCSGSAPAPTYTTLTCASKFGSTYTGNYTQTTTKACNPTNLTWSVETTTDNSATACTNRTCALPAPSGSSASYSCSTLGEGFTGNYTDTKSYTCDTSSLQWKETITSTKDQCQNSYTKLSQLQNVNGVVEVPAGVTAYIDKSINIQQLKINGTLKCLLPSQLEILAETIFVNGVFECGTAAAPYQGQLTLSLKRNAQIIPRTGRELNGSAYNDTAKAALNANNNAALNFRAILVTGQIKLFGIVKNKMTRLNQTAQAGQSSIVVENAQTWKVGDQIAIAATGFNPSESESATITNISGNTLTLNKSLSYMHWGAAPESFSHSSGQTFSLDQRAEVINLTRNIKIEAYDRLSDGTEANQLNPDQETSEPGGHVMVHQSGFAQISSVEFYKMGQAGIMARYPFHWHRSGNVNGQYIVNSSIHRSFQRCITVHATNNSVVENNVCYDFRGHGYFLEDGNETGNIIRNNIGMWARLPHASKILLASDDRAQTTDMRFPATAVFWISHPQNTVTGNIAAGSMGTGFWNAFETNSVKLSTTAFGNNTAHTTLVGHTWDGAPGSVSANNPNNYADRKLENAHYSPPAASVFDKVIAYKNSQAGVYFRGGSAIFTNALLADNMWSLFLAYNQIFRNTVIVGQSQYVAPNKPKHWGVILYDGPFEMENVDFYNFNNQPTSASLSDHLDYVPFYVIGGSEKFVNTTRNLRFIPQVNFKFLLEPKNDPWKDKIVTQAIRDQDGSLTGLVGGLIVPRNDISSDNTCQIKNEFIGAKLCPAATQVGIFMLASGQYGGAQGVQLPFVIRKNDSMTSITEADVNEIRSGTGPFLNAKFLAINKPEYKYDLIFSDDFTNRNKVNDVWIRFYTENSPGMSQIVKIKNYGSNCSLSGATRVSSLAELAQASSTSYYSNESSFFIKMKADRLHEIIIPNSGRMTPYYGMSYLNCSGGYSAATDRINHDSSTTTPIGGTAKGIIGEVNANGVVSGWACLTGQSAPIALHVYVGASAANGGTFAGGGSANIPSEPAVGQACSDPSNSPHRFSIQITTAGNAGKKVYVHAIDNATNPTIDQSGVFVVPNVTAPAAKEIRGYIDGLQTDGTVVGWLCLAGQSAPAEYHVYGGGAAGAGGTIVGAGVANVSSESAVGQACGDNTNSPHRFAFKPPAGWSGKTIYIHGINNSDNKTITNSGSFSFK